MSSIEGKSADEGRPSMSWIMDQTIHVMAFSDCDVEIQWIDRGGKELARQTVKMESNPVHQHSFRSHPRPAENLTELICTSCGYFFIDRWTA